MRPIEEAPGVYRLPVFIPFRTKPTNVYILVGDRIALFDTGTGHPRTWEELTQGLATLDLAPTDVQTVILSHAHVDHTGLAHRFDRAEVLIGPRDHPKMLDFPGHLQGLAAAVARHTASWGIPEALAGSLRAPITSLLGMSSSVPWAEPLPGGSVVEGLGPSYRVLGFPGHTEGGIGLYREHDGLLLSGDHILEEITPNPGIVVADSGVTSGLPEYMASLDALESLDVATVLPGHGRSFVGLRERIRSIRAHHEERLGEIERCLGDGRSLAALVAAMFEISDPLSGFLALSEVFGHLVVLEARERVAPVTDAGGIDIYRCLERRDG